MAPLDLQPHTSNPSPATTLDQEAVTDTAVTPSHALDHARAADHLWREQRRVQLEKQLARGQWFHERLIKPLITALSILLMTQSIRFIHRPDGFGVDLSSDWALVQWCTRYLIFLILFFLSPISVHRWVSRKFARWEARLRQELEQPHGA